MAKQSRDRGTGWLAAGYAGIAGFFVLEAATRKRGAASSLRDAGGDHGTTATIVAAYTVGTELTPLLRRLPVPLLPRVIAPVGLVTQAAGLALRAWSMRELGSAYTRTLRTQDAQRVIDTGPYRLVRHPGYTGSLLTWTGFALASRSVPVFALIAGALGLAYRRRIIAEERLLRRDLPGYVEYAEHTKRLVPFIW